MKNPDLLHIYQRSFAVNWELPALTDYVTKEAISYAELSRRIAMTHLLFKKMGIKHGDKIALMGPNSVRWIVSYMATITYGATIVPVLQEFHPQDAQHIIHHSDAVLLIISESIFEHFNPENLTKLKAVLLLDKNAVLYEHKGDKVEKMVDNMSITFAHTYPAGFAPTDIRYPTMPANSIAEINYTSGTTGFSKGVMLTFENLWGNVNFGLESNLYAPGDRCLCFLPLAHAYGCAFDMLAPLASGATVTVLGKAPTPVVLMKAFAEVRPTLILCVPLILEKIYKRSILPVIQGGMTKRMLSVPGLNMIVRRKIKNKLVEVFGGAFSQVIVGGAPLNPEVEKFLHDIGFPFTVGYGMTECGPLISYTPWKKFIVGSCGRTIPGMESRIDKSDDPERVPGEICVRGTNVMVGYYKNPQATEDVIDAEGWLHTGDMGTRSSDGTLFIKGRYKTMILTATGQNIYPEEIEAKLNNMPYVGESLVLERNGRLVALVYPDFELMDKQGVTIETIEAIMEKIRVHLNSMVAPYEKIDRIQVHPDEFAKTPKRSIKRFLYN